jgi:hypothetical protein
VEGGFLLSRQALKLAVVPDPSAFLIEGQEIEKKVLCAFYNFY